MSENNDKLKDALKGQLDQDLGITKEYNKENRDKLWDSQKGKKEYKDKVFDGNKVIQDPYSDNMLHYDTNAAKNKYHMKNSEGENNSTKWANHVAETDHVTSLKNVHDSLKNDPFLSDSDLKDIANDESNYRILSKHENTSKGEKSDLEYIKSDSNDMTPEGKKKMVHEKLKSSGNILVHGAGATVKNAGFEFIDGASKNVQKSIVPLTAIAVDNIMDVVKGEQDFSEALKNTGKSVVDVAVVGGTSKLIEDIIFNMCNDNSKEILNKITGSPYYAELLSLAGIVKDSAEKFVNGDINGREFVEEIGEKGTLMVSSMVGGQIGREIGKYVGIALGVTFVPGPLTTVLMVKAGEIVGEILGGVIATVACSTVIAVYKKIKHINDYKQKEKELSHMINQSLEVIKEGHERLKVSVDNFYETWDAAVKDGFDEIERSERTHDFEGFSNGLNTLLELFGSNVTFKTMDEFDDFFFDEDAVLVL